VSLFWLLFIDQQNFSLKKSSEKRTGIKEKICRSDISKRVFFKKNWKVEKLKKKQS